GFPGRFRVLKLCLLGHSWCGGLSTEQFENQNIT
ncbi:transposase, partial [Escherichia coli]